MPNFQTKTQYAFGGRRIFLLFHVKYYYCCIISFLRIFNVLDRFGVNLIFNRFSAIFIKTTYESVPGSIFCCFTERFRNRFTGFWSHRPERCFAILLNRLFCAPSFLTDGFLKSFPSNCVSL